MSVYVCMSCVYHSNVCNCGLSIFNKRILLLLLLSNLAKVLTSTRTQVVYSCVCRSTHGGADHVKTYANNYVEQIAAVGELIVIELEVNGEMQ